MRNNELRIAVRELAEYTLQEGDLNLESFVGTSRAKAGIRAHQKIQDSRTENYTAEVTINHTITQNELTLNISGRMDGIFIYPDKIVIDEIKTTSKSLKFFVVESNKIHWGQAKIYAYIYALQNSLEEIHVQLTYYHLETKQQKELIEKYTFSQLTDFFNSIMTIYFKWAKVIYNWQIMRDESLENLQFPFEEYRKGQRVMAVETFRAIRDKKQLLVQAPTGIGKTMATIFPAVKCFPEEMIRKLFFFTARTTGKELAYSACDILQKRGAKLKTLVLTAKEKICLSKGSACNAEECKYAKGYYDRIQGAVEELFASDMFDRDTIINCSEKYTVCPFEFSLYISLWSDIIICDYNYGFDPKVYLKRFFSDEISDKNYAFLIDEAHNLVDRSRDMFSASLDKKLILDVRRPLKNKLDNIYKSLGKLNSILLKYRKEAEDEDDFFISKEYPNELIPLLKKFMSQTEKWLAQNIRAIYRKDLLEIYFEVMRFLRVMETYDDHYLTTYERKGNNLIIKLFCVDPSSQMKEALERCSSATFFSATLTPKKYFSQIFGLDENAKKMILPSPFPKENLLVMRADISTRYKQRAETSRKISETIEQMVSAKKGNYLIFLPSYKYMKMIADIFVENQPDLKIQIQQSGMSELEREEFLKNFSIESNESLVSFAVMGGVFGEGIDLVGNRLDGVAIVGVGLPGISKERSLIRDYYNQENLGFEYAYQYPGINRVLQAAGRVIRTETDRGIVVLIDDRFRWSSYRNLLPKSWKIKTVPNKLTMQKILDDFWEEKGELI